MDDELGSMWNYQESIDELRNKLLHTIVERDSLKAQAHEEMRKHKIYEEQLIKLLKIAYHERDEVKGQLQNLLNQLMLMPAAAASTPADSQHPMLLQAQPESLTESNSLSGTCNHFSPVDSLFKPVSSPDFAGISMANSSQFRFANEPFVDQEQYNNGSSPAGLTCRAAGSMANPADAVIDDLVKGKDLPPKGKLLSTVMKIGPLLQTLVAAGPFPRWRNPPPLQQQLVNTASVSVKGCGTACVTKHKPAARASKRQRFQ